MTQAAGPTQRRAAALLQPIAADNPGGHSARTDPRHEALRAEIAKLDAPGGGEVDWPSVVRDATTLLSATSKDLLVASALAFGCLQTEGLSGLASGLPVVTGLLRDFWETTFPPPNRMRGRANALAWLVTRLEITLPALTITAADRQALDAVVAAYAELSAVARERMADAAPGMGTVTEVLARMDLKIPATTAAAVEPASAQRSATPTEVVGAAPIPAERSTSPDAQARAHAARWLEPIAPDAPTGTDARYEPEYEAMRTEVRKLESARGEEIDWPTVAAHASVIVQRKSKDVLAASYWAFAQLKTRGLVGLAEGLAVVVGLFESFPEARWPQRPRGQGNAVAWLADQLALALESIEPRPGDRPALLAVDALLATAGPLLRTQLAAHAPSVRPCTERVTRMLLAVREAAPTPPAPPASPAPSPSPPSASSAPTGSLPTPAAEVGGPDDVAKYLLETGRALVKAANVLRRAAVDSPAAYRLFREGLYLHVDHPPPADAGGRTKVPPLPAPRRAQLDRIAQHGKWAALVEESESALMQFRFCLDLHRMTAEALAGLGHAEALASMRAALGGVLGRMPQWPTLLAADGSVLANDTTRAWLAELAGVPAPPPETDADRDSDAHARGRDPDGLAKAKALIAQGQVAAALKVAQASIEAATRPRHRFTRRLDLAELCRGAGQHRLARGIFAGLDEELATLGIAEWEPVLATRCLEGLVRSQRALTQKGAPPDPAAEVAFVRLCRLDPSAAARLARD